MSKPTIEEQLRKMKQEPDALDQSIALNHIVMNMLEDKRRSDRWIRIICIVSLVCNVLIAGMFIVHDSQMITTTETVTVTQDSGDNPGNNVYQSGENAQYVQGTEEVTDDGTASDNYHTDNQNP